MDAVITYVNMHDPVWIKQYKETFNTEPETRRYKEFGTIDLQISSIRKYIPWIDKIFVVVSSKSQLTTDQAIVVTHDQIIPEEYLPTFNSCTIELFLHKIPGLSDYFIYFNDDIFPVNYCRQDSFFDSKPVLCFKTLDTRPENTYRMQCKNGADLARVLLNQQVTNVYVKPDHICLIHSKKVFEEVWNKAEQTLRDSITKKRNSTNLNQYLFVDYLYYSNQCNIKRLNYTYVQTSKVSPEKMYDTITNSDYDLVCVHDNAENNEVYYSIIKEGLKTNLREKTIDLVVPYVDNRDPQWISNYEKYVSQDLGYGSNDERFRSYDLFKYFFRGVNRYMKFIRKIHLVVASESQVPGWLNRDTVHVVTHDQFIPKEFLPVFNSCTIEMFLKDIPDLSDRFIYANDDVYATGMMTEQDFFENSVPVFGYREDDFNKKWAADYIRYNVHRLVTGSDEKKVYRLQHVFIPYLKSTLESCYEIYGQQMRDSITRVRDPKNLSQWLYTVYQLRVLESRNHTLPHAKARLSVSKIKYFDDDRLKVVCLNDTGSTTIKDVQIVEQVLRNKFSNKSVYEI